MRKFTSLMLMLLCAVTTWAGVTDLPEMSTEGNTKWYTIRNTRSTSGKYLYWTGDASEIQDANTITNASFFYFTGTTDACYIHNAATSNLFADINSWTAEGTVCSITVTPHSSAAGVAIGFKGTYLNERNTNAGYTTWSANDAGSIFVIEPITASIEEAIAVLEANRDANNTIMGEYKYEEQSYNNLVAALNTLKSTTEDVYTAFEACNTIIASLSRVMPEAGKFYVIEAPLFYNVQGVNKGLYVNEEGALGWNTIDLTNKAFYWNVEVVDGTYAIKNVNTSTYINGSDMSESAVYGNLTALGEEQFNIIINGVTLHANNHGSGSGAGSNVISWGGSVGSASAWAFIEKNDPDASVPVTVVYNFMYEGVKKYTQTTETIAGENYPDANIALPFGVSATAPEEVINAGDATEIDGVKTITREIELTVSLPFEYYNSYSDVTQWYYVNVRDDGPTYMYYDSSIEYIKATATAVPSDAKDAYSWAFVGNPFDGFKVVNLLAGSTMVLSSPATPTANQDASQIVRMVTEEGATGNTDWDFMKPTHANAAANGFYIQHPTAPAYALNRQGYNGANTVCYWDSRDTGSTFQVVARPSVQGELEALIATAEAKLATMESLKSEAAGFYSQATIDELAAAISVAQEVTVADEEDITTLQAAIDAVHTNTPAIGSFIAFQSASTQTYCAGKYVKTVPAVTTYEGGGYSANRDHTQLVFDTFEPATTPSAVFQVIAGDNEGEFKLKNMHTQEYVVSFVKNAKHMGAEANAVAVRLEPLGKDQQVAVYGANHADPMHAQQAHNVIVTCDTSADGASAWNIINVESFAHVLTISEVGYATLKLGFDATIPEGVECYYAIEAIDENGVLNLEQITGILPANTAVIVKLAEGYAAGDYNFTYSATAGTAVENNKLAGSVYDENISTAGTAYVLSAPAPEGKVGLYKATLTEGAFLNNANKAYFEVETANGIASYSFNFEWAGTTGIDGVVAEGAENGAIYDITGRRVKAITAPGIYIVNGRKVVK